MTIYSRKRHGKRPGFHCGCVQSRGVDLFVQCCPPWHHCGWGPCWSAEQQNLAVSLSPHPHGRLASCLQRRPPQPTPAFGGLPQAQMELTVVLTCVVRQQHPLPFFSYLLSSRRSRSHGGSRPAPGGHAPHSSQLQRPLLPSNSDHHSHAGLCSSLRLRYALFGRARNRRVRCPPPLEAAALPRQVARWVHR